MGLYMFLINTNRTNTTGQLIPDTSIIKTDH